VGCRFFCRFFLGAVSVFFFQAEDGIRDRNVTGVQTCALPILEVCPGIFRPGYGGESPPEVWKREGLLGCLFSSVRPQTFALPLHRLPFPKKELPAFPSRSCG